LPSISTLSAGLSAGTIFFFALPGLRAAEEIVFRMFLPFQTNIRPRRTPYATYVLIGINFAVFVMELTVSPRTGGYTFRPWVHDFWLVPRLSPWWTYVTYAFLHHDFWHVFFNMFFLYLFGRNVNDKLGPLGYVAFYVVGAVLSGMGQGALHGAVPRPTLGASGAVAAITGAYLVLFPQSVLTVIYWFFFIGTLEIPALYFILIKLILIDNLLARGQGSVAYEAHLAGYVFGVAATLVLLAAHLVEGSSYDLLAMLKRWNRRRQYRGVVADGYDPFMGMGPRKRVEAREVPPPDAGSRHRHAQVREIRLEIDRLVEQRNLPAAADLYVKLMQLDPGQLLARQHLLDIANQLASDHRAAEAARAYEQFLTHYAAYEYAEQVELMLGILYARYLQEPGKAIKHLRNAADKLTDPGQLRMCREELAKLGA
jgi:membrane associated rhomboid family serine protease